MSKKKSLALLGVLAVLSLTACGGSGTNSGSGSTSVPGTSDQTTEEPGDKPVPPTTIFDAWDETRPDFGGMFDFIPDYEQPEPPKPNTKVLVKIDETSGIKFKDGTTEKEILTGTQLKLDDFDVSSAKDNRSIEGFVTTGEGYDSDSITKIDNFLVGKHDVVLNPVFSPLPGYTRMLMGGAGSSKINLSNCIGSIATNNTIKISGETAVKGDENSALQVGYRVKEISPVTDGSTVRFDMHSKTISGVAGVKEFRYNFENHSTEELHLNIYQIGGWAEQASAYKDRYRIDIDLLPGEVKSYMGQYKLGINGGENELMWVVADSDMKNMDFGFSVTAKVTDLTEPTTVSKPEPARPMTVKLELPEGIKVNGYDGKSSSGSKLVLPKDTQIQNDTGKKIGGWHLAGNNGMIVDGNYALPKHDITIAPFFISNEGQHLFAAMSGSHKGADYYGTIDDASGDYVNRDYIEPGKEIIGKTDFSLDGYLGTRITYTGESLNNKNFFRMLTYTGPRGSAAGIQANHKYKFVYTLRNDAKEDMVFEFSQNQGGCKFTAKDGAYNSGIITLKPNETKVLNVEITLSGSNDNIMPMIVIRQKITGLNLVVSMVKHNL